MKFMRLLAIGATCSMLLVSCTKERNLTDLGNLVPKTVDQDASLPSITVNGVKLHSEAFGHPDSTLVVCIHGGPGADYRYLLNCQELAGEGYRVVFYDQIGSGLSQRFSKDHYLSNPTVALNYFYEELAGVIAHYKTHPTQKVYLLGHSWGAMLATAYSGKHPAEIQGLVLCEPGGLKWDDVVEYAKNLASYTVFKEEINDGPYLDQFISSETDEHIILDYKFGLYGSSEHPISGDDLRFPGSFWRSGAVLNSVTFELGNQVKPDFSEGIANFNVPVLFFHSEENKAYPVSWAQKVSGVFNTVELFQTSGSHSEMIQTNSIWSSVTKPKVISYFNSL